jgi:general L-amino acid transport system substrate-binding protein
MSKLVRIFGLLVALSLVLTACAQQPTPTPQKVVETVVVTVEVPVTAAPATPAPPPAPSGFGETLKAIKARGKLVCGVNGQLPGFSFRGPAGELERFRC